MSDITPNGSGVGRVAESPPPPPPPPIIPGHAAPRPMTDEERAAAREKESDHLAEVQAKLDFEKKRVDRLQGHAIDQVMAYGKWPRTPLPLFSNRNLPPFPVGNMPPVLKNMVTEVATNAQVAVDLPAVIALAALSASLVGRVEVHPEPGWREVVTLYTLGLAESGTRKSLTMSRMIGPLLQTQKELKDQIMEQRRLAERQKENAKARMDAAKKKAARTGADDDWTAYELAQRSYDIIVVPELPVMVTTDATPEALAKTMETNGERISVFDAEGGGLTTMAGTRYSNAPYIDLLLKGHVGDATSQLRIGREPTNLSRPVITIGVLSQPETLRELMGVRGASNRGLIDRFIIAAPPDTLGHRETYVPQVGIGTISAYHGLLNSFITTLWSEPETRLLGMTPDGRERIKKFQEECEPRFRADGDLRAARGFGGKFIGTVARLAAIHHLATYGAHTGLQYGVDRPSVEWAIEVAEWALEHYSYAVRAAGEVADVADADRIISWLRRRTDKTTTISTRDVQLGTRLANEQTVNALELLVEHGWLRPGPIAKAKGPGRPASPRWELHPDLTDD